jgi:branched-chain amino acid transport system ATP-binding protein
MLSIVDLYKSFNKKILFNGINVDFREGKIYTLVGINGVGKTTLFNIITGFIKPDSGSVSLNGIMLNSQPPDEIARLGISRTFQDLRIIPSMTVTDNITLGLDKKLFRFQTSLDRNRIKILLSNVNLLHKANELAGNLSYGMQKLLSIATSLATDPKWLLLDEPISGIDTINRQNVEDLIINLKHNRKGIIQIEHNLKYIRETSDVIIFLTNGELYTFTSFSDFINNNKVKSIYLKWNEQQHNS